MDKEKIEEDYQRCHNKSHVEAGIVAMENLLDGGRREDAVYVIEKVKNFIEVLHDHPHVAVSVISHEQINDGVDALDTVIWEMNK